MIRPLVFDLQKFSIHDGPGIRTTVFLKGCPLHCLWCHNPESQSPEAELFFESRKCTSCRNCETVCPVHCHRFRDGEHVLERGLCIHCGKCAEQCPADALAGVGFPMEIRRIVAEVMKDEPFYRNSGGGVTVSGGEPMMFPEFTRELLRACREKGLSTALETCGFCREDALRAVIPFTDLFLFDVKCVDPARHRKFTGADNAPILKNLRMLDREGAALRLRCPLIPGWNDSDADLEALAELAEELEHVTAIDTEPYHPLGEDKSLRLGRGEVFSAGFPTPEQTAAWRRFLAERTSVPVT